MSEGGGKPQEGARTQEEKSKKPPEGTNRDPFGARNLPPRTVNGKERKRRRKGKRASLNSQKQQREE